MANPTNSLSLLERADFYVRVTRCSGRNRPLQIEALQEFPGADLSPHADAIAALVQGGELICAVRPKTRRLHLSSTDEAKRHWGMAGARQFAGGPTFAAFGPAWFALGPASAEKADPRWLVELATETVRGDVLAMADTLKVKPTRFVSLTMAGIGAIAGASQAPVWILDVGEVESYAMLLSKGALRAIGTVSLTLDKIAEAVQTELGLKFRGSAAKLFFNDQYDFSEVETRIAQKLAPVLQTEMTALRGSHEAAVSLACLGLPTKQRWLGVRLANTLGLEAFQVDLKPWSASAGLCFAKPELENALAPEWLASLQLAAAQLGASTPAGRWQAEWLRPEDAVSGSEPVPAAKAAPTNAPAPKNPPASPGAERPTGKGASGAGGGQPPSARVVPPMPVLLDEPATATLAAKKTAPAKATESAVSYPPKSTSGKAKAEESSVSYPAKPAIVEKAAKPMPTSAPAPKQASAPRDETAGHLGDDVEEAAPSKRKSKLPIIAAAVGAVAVAIGGVAYYLRAQNAEESRLRAEKIAMEQRVKAETEKARLAQEQARAEAENRKKFEVDALQKLATAEAARKQAEQDAQTQAAARLANARGSIAVSSDPVGASIAVDGETSRTTPATITDLKIGRHRLVLTHPQCDPVALDLQVNENATTDVGVVKLARAVGTLVLTTDPAGIPYGVAPAGITLAGMGSQKSGRTPASLDDLSPGDYVVTFTRDGWEPHVEKVSIARNATARVEWAIPTGIIKIASAPAGATVLRNGATLGVTPLTLTAQPPGDVAFELAMPGFATARVAGRLARGEVLGLNGKLAPTDHIATLSELDQLPVPTVSPKPTAPHSDFGGSGSVVLQVLVDREGVPRDVKIVKSTDPALSQVCLDAIAKWKFRPGMMGGKPVATRVSLPFNFDANP